MAPDVEELIKRVNTLTLDKNRLKQKLTQLTNGQTNGKEPLNKSLSKLSSSSSFESASTSNTTAANSRDIHTSHNVNNNTSSISSSPPSSTASTNKTPSPPGRQCNQVAGVECATSCEEDILYMNELYRKRLDEYDANWDMMQSKCSALLSELNALQKQFVRMRREQMEWEEKYRSKCEENENIRSELQTIVLNYETQLSAMSEHLSGITRQLSLEDSDPSDGASMRSIRNPNYID